MDKVTKYKLKYDYLLTIIGGELSEFVREDFNFYIDDKTLKGGNADNIWPVITTKWKRLNNLGIIGIYNKENNFKIIPDNLYKTTVPLLNKGYNNVIYKIFYMKNKQEYILRMHENSNPSLPHMIDLPKIKEEFEKYKKYLIKIYFYGKIQTTDNIVLLKPDNKIEITPKYKTYEYNHIITKKYNTPIFKDEEEEDDDEYIITNMTNKQKFLFLLNNIQMLSDLQKNNQFHSDYKLSNLGWENNETMNVILIDYDSKTIQTISKDIISEHTNKHDEFELKFPVTYSPKYIGTGSKRGWYKELYIKNFDDFDKYSIGGLIDVIQKLNIKYTKQVNLIQLLKLESINYDEIPMYDVMYTKIKELEPFLK